jgi:hypothetical protein
MSKINSAMKKVATNGAAKDLRINFVSVFNG